MACLLPDILGFVLAAISFRCGFPLRLWQAPWTMLRSPCFMHSFTRPRSTAQAPSLGRLWFPRRLLWHGSTPVSILAATSERCAAFQRSLSLCHEPVFLRHGLPFLRFRNGLNGSQPCRVRKLLQARLFLRRGLRHVRLELSLGRRRRARWLAGSTTRLPTVPFLVTALLRHCRFSVLPPDCRGIFLYLVRYVRQARRYKTWYEQNATPA